MIDIIIDYFYCYYYYDYYNYIFGEKKKIEERIIIPWWGGKHHTKGRQNFKSLNNLVNLSFLFIGTEKKIKKKKKK